MARMNEGFPEQWQDDGGVNGWSLVPMDHGTSPVDSNAEVHWAPQGPGWFDSSWLLRQGLEVTELCSVAL